MRHLTFIIIAALLALTGCQKYETDISSKKSFKGDIVVTNSDGSKFTDKNISSEVTNSLHGEGLCDIFLKGVKFASAMPVRIDMTIPSATIDEEGNISGTNLVPWAMGGPFEEWTISTFTGKITYDNAGNPDTFEFSMICGEYPVTYKAKFRE